MRDYIPKDYKLPRAVYYQALYAVRDYDRLHAEYNDIMHASASPADGMPRGSNPGGRSRTRRSGLSTSTASWWPLIGRWTASRPNTGAG